MHFYFMEQLKFPHYNYTFEVMYMYNYIKHYFIFQVVLEFIDVIPIEVNRMIANALLVVSFILE